MYGVENISRVGKTFYIRRMKLYDTDGPDGSGCLSQMNNHEQLPVFETNALVLVIPILGVISSKQRSVGGARNNFHPTTNPYNDTIR